MTGDASTEARLVPLFPTHVLSGAWSQAGEHGPALRETILRRRTAEPLAPATRLGWRSDDDMINWGGAAAHALCEHVSRRADAATHDRRQQGSAIRFDWSVEMWAHVTEQQGSIQVHSHPGAWLSAIYHVDDGYAGSDDPALGGELVFVDPRYPLVRMRTPGLRAQRGDGSVDQHEVRLRPASGQFVIFPSWLSHGVLPFHGRGPRVTIGINLAARYKR